MKPRQQQMFFWIVALAALILILLLLRDVLLPFVAGMAIAYFLDPVADRLETIGLSRLWATLVIVMSFVVMFVVFVIVLVPILVQQLSGLGANLPGYISSLQQMITEQGQGWLSDVFGIEVTQFSGSIQNLVQKATDWLGGLLTSIWSGGIAFVSFLALFIVTPVVAFYMLYDWDRMVAKIDSWLPRDHVAIVRQLAAEIDVAIAGFVRGQGTVCLILGTFYAIGLTVIGLNFGLLIGLVAGLISFVPYVGSTLGLVVAGIVAVVQFWPEWIPIASVLGVFIFGQFAEGNFLSPKMVGSSVGLHPVWLMFALFAFAYLFGFVGMLLAVPLAAAIGVLSRFSLQQYLASDIYTGMSDDD